VLKFACFLTTIEHIVLGGLKMRWWKCDTGKKCKGGKCSSEKCRSSL